MMILSHPIHTYYIMIVTLVILLVNWIVLTLNSIPYLPLHALYLAALAFALWKRRQPPSYSLSVEQVREMLLLRGKGEGRGVAECGICGKAKPSRYYHCRHCNRCVYRLDHHCNFVDNCIGQYNSKVYVHFLANALLHSLAVITVTAINYNHLLDFTSISALFTLTILPALFGAYECSRLLRAFWTTVKRNQTLIESYKQVRGPKATLLDSFQVYFGQRGVKWLLPTFVKNGCCDLL
jgi:palmitoyltransferase